MKLIDLSMEFHEGMQTFTAAWHPFYEITQLGRHGIENRETKKIVLGTHMGTHIDAPLHFIPNGETVENIPLKQLVGEALVVDFSELEDFSAVSAAMLKEKTQGRSVRRLIIRFDWDRHLNTNKYYSHHPYLSEDCCEWLVSGGCELLAMDTPQPDNPINGRASDNDAPNHKILLGSSVVLVEYMVNLKEIIKPEVFLVVAPLKIRNGDGAPARCFVIDDL